jgi:hypothetical protein
MTRQKHPLRWLRRAFDLGIVACFSAAWLFGWKVFGLVVATALLSKLEEVTVGLIEQDEQSGVEYDFTRGQE